MKRDFFIQINKYLQYLQDLIVNIYNIYKTQEYALKVKNKVHIYEQLKFFLGR